MANENNGESAESRIVRAVLRLARRLRQSVLDTPLTGSGLTLLASLHRDGSMSAVALARNEGLQPQSLSRLLNRLESAGLIEQSTDPVDRRRHIIAITCSGRAALNQAMGQRRQWLAEAIAQQLDETERATLLAAADIMLKIAASVQRGTHCYDR